MIAIPLVFIMMGAYFYYDIFLKQKINGSLLIDNPTNRTISVQIDGNSYQVPPHQYVKADGVSLGKHKISCQECGLSNEDLNINPVEYGVINPTKSKYVIYNIVYTQKDLRSEFKPYQVEGREVYSSTGKPEVLTDLFIPDRTLGNGNIDDETPSSQSYERFTQNQSVLSKIFRINDFFTFYDQALKKQDEN